MKPRRPHEPSADLGELAKRNPDLERAMTWAHAWDQALADGLATRGGSPLYEMTFTPLGERVRAALAKGREVALLDGDTMPKAGRWAYVADRLHLYRETNLPACGHGPTYEGGSKTPANPWCRACLDIYAAEALAASHGAPVAPGSSRR